MSATNLQHCLASGPMLMEQFIPDHVFIYVTKGTINCFDGNKTYTFKTGEYGIARKNRLAKYYGEKDGGEFERIVFCYDETDLRNFQKKHNPVVTKFTTDD